MEFTQLYQTFIKAKKAYYEGNPIMEDFEFDELESQLQKFPEFQNLVGFGDENRNAKFKHPSRMLSLAKIQAGADKKAPTESFLSWSSKKHDDLYTATPKYDGNAVNCVYKNGILDVILSRGNGTAGRDYAEKLYHRVPKEIETEFPIVEIRGEIVISTFTFVRKYSSEYKNERNFVAGILNRDEDVSDIIQHFDFLPVEIRGHKDGDFTYLDIKEFILSSDLHKEFIIPDHTYFPKDCFEIVYDEMIHYRNEICKYRLDGFVIKTYSAEKKKEYGENDHHPEWSIAIKFPPQEAITEVIKIQWNFGKTGKLTPVAILKPVLLDGSTVRRATVHNFGWMVAKNCLPGATVMIAKKGDIIPQIIEVR